MGDFGGLELNIDEEETQGQNQSTQEKNKNRYATFINKNKAKRKPKQQPLQKEVLKKDAFNPRPLAATKKAELNAVAPPPVTSDAQEKPSNPNPRKRPASQGEGEREGQPAQKRAKTRAPLSALTRKVISYDDILKLAAARTASEPQAKKDIAPSNLFKDNATFEELGISARLIKALNEKLQHTKPTSIQTSAIPAIMNNNNVLVKAETGSGKTLTYLIPIVSRLLDLDTVDRTQGSYALVIAPTRELVLQIYEVLSQLVKSFPWIVVGHIIGGEKKKSEKSRIRKGITILIATPGRLLDHLQNTNAFKLNFLKWLVFDEADRLLDMGFEREVTQIMKLLNEKALDEQNPIQRQNILLSATLSKALSNLASVNLEKPVFIGLDNSAEEKEDNERNYNTHKIPDTLRQFYITTPMKKKLILLATFLRWKVKEKKDCKIIVFFSNCDSVEYFFTLFSAIQTPTQPPHLVKKNHEEYESLVPTQLFKLHGNMAQNTRTPTFHTFRSSNSAVLFCTDVAARGLDLPHVNWIVQYDPPSDPRAYIHRVGRTARIGQLGNAVVFITPQEKSYIQVLNSKNMILEEMPFESVVAHLKTNFEKNLQNDPEVEMGALQFRFQFAVQKTDKDVDFQAMAVVAFQSFVRSYATHTKSTRHIFDMKNLHLGHLAKSFALQDPPSSFLHTKKEPKKKKDNQRKMVTTFSQSSEFSDGLN